MITLPDRRELEETCRRHGVVRLELFGSASGSAFNPDRSDVDFLVQFADGYDLGPWLSEYFKLKKELEDLLGRSVDLVMADAPKNPHFLQELNRTRRVIYEHSDAKTP